MAQHLPHLVALLAACLAYQSAAASPTENCAVTTHQGISLLQRAVRVSVSGPPSNDGLADYPVVMHAPPSRMDQTSNSEVNANQEQSDHRPEHEERGEEDPEGNEISKSIGTDLLGDSLEPTHNGHGLAGATQEAKEEEKAEGHDEIHHHKYLALLFFFGALAIGSVVLIFLERFLPMVPYTVALFVAGMLVSIVHCFKPHDSLLHWPAWFASVEMWQGINPHLLFYAFLPALLFGEAMRLNVTLVSKCFSQVFLLACPGVLLGTLLTAVVGKYVLPYGWDWPISLVFGTILSATDPVAVVALFNTLGVSPRLTMLISGESLLNDGTAIVCFALMLKVALGASLTPGGVIVFFGHMTLSAVALGGSIGLIAVFVIGRCCDNRCHSDTMIQVVVTIAFGYLAFFLAESEFSTSGVISTVSGGFVIAYYAWPRFTSRETMHTVWETIEFIGNTIIFFLAGAIFADNVLSRWSYIGPSDFGLLLLLYFSVTAIRAIMILVFWAPMNMVGTKVHWREVIVMVWSGLRGAVSLALAIIVDMEPGISKQMGSRIMFHVGGIAALTFLINATTASPLLKLLEITKTPHVKERMLLRVSQHLAEHTSTVFEAQFRHQEDVRFCGANQHVVRSMVPALSGTLTLAGPRAAPPHERDSEQALGKLFREAFLRVVHNSYWEAIGDGIIPRHLKAARVLLNSTDEALEHTEICLSDWEAIAREIGNTRISSQLSKQLSAMVERKPLCWITPLWHAFSEEAATMQKVYIALSFQEAHARARAEVPRYFSADGGLDTQVQQQVARESSEQCKRASELLQSVPAQTVEQGKSEMLARRLLHLQQDRIGHLREKGLLTDSEASHMEHQVRQAARQIANASKDLGGGGSALLSGLMPHK